MPDLALFVGNDPEKLAAPWEIVDRNSDFTLYLNPESGWRKVSSFTSESLCASQIGDFDEPQKLEKILDTHDLRSATMAKAWNHWGYDLAVNCKGVISGFIFDKVQKKAYIFRDRVGLIPIVWIEFDDYTLITSSPELFRDFSKSKSWNDACLRDFLLCSHSEENTDWKADCYRLRPSEYMTVEKNGVESKFYNFLENAAPLDPSIHDAKALLLDAFQSAMLRCPKENIVLSLSGGLDSGAIAAWVCDNSFEQKKINRAFSMVSSAFANADESSMLDIWEELNNLQITRVEMQELVKSKQSSSAANAWGPVASPGMELSLAFFKFVAENAPNSTLLTGFGGNFIVKSRKETIFRELFKNRDFMAIYSEWFSLNAVERIKIAHRFIANSKDGFVIRLFKSLPPQIKKRIFTIKPDFENPRLWLTKDFIGTFQDKLSDPFFQMSQIEERAAIIRSREWEWNMRQIDAISREAKLAFHDPLLDAELFKLCARIPARYWDYNNQYRFLWKEALETILPKKIREHPKVQHFDPMINHALKESLQKLLGDLELNNVEAEKRIDHKRLKHFLQEYLRQYQQDPGSVHSPIRFLWRSLALAREFNCS